MNGIQLFITELKTLFQKKKVLGSVIAAILVPLVYGAILLASEAGPRDNLDNLPVAVVNNDVGAESNGEPIHVGNDLVENLKGNPTLKWDFVTSEEAEKGLDDMEYYMVIEIPEDFSQNVTTVLDEEPVNPELKFIKNEGLHYMASQITDSAIETLRTQLSTQVTETYVRNLFAQLGEVSDGFQSAADGSAQIYDGSIQLKDGTTQILDSLNEKAPDIERLSNGAEELEAGSQEMLQSLTSKQGDITKLANGTEQLNNGTEELLANLKGKAGDIATLAQGAEEVNAGTGLLLSTIEGKKGDIKDLAVGAEELANGAESLNTGAAEILAGLESAKSGSAQLLGGLNTQLVPGSKEVANGVNVLISKVEDTGESLASMYQTLEEIAGDNEAFKNDPRYIAIKTSLQQSLAEAQMPETKEMLVKLSEGANAISAGLESKIKPGVEDLNNGLTALVDGQKLVSNGAIELEAGSKKLSAGNESVYYGWNELSQNVAILHNGTSQIAAGNATVEQGWYDLINGATELHAGASQVNDGNQTVEAGWQQLSAGASQLNDGAGQISEGNATVKEGWTTLIDGVSQVDNGLGDLQSGSNELLVGLKGGAESTSQLRPGDANMAMFASPVVLDGEIVNGFEFYRDSTVPYIMSIALFAGIVAMSLIVHFQKPAIAPASGASWFIGKTLKLSVLAVVQAILISVFVLTFLSVKVESSLLFILFSIMVSLTFLMLVLFLVAFAGNLGRFIALVIIILQMPTTGSSLPIDMLPEQFRELSTFLPLTYTIDGFRSIVSLGNFSNVFGSIGVLFIYFAGAGVLAYIVFYVKFKKEKFSVEPLPTQQ
ncbi:YhgE/Pip family protein [Salirhabdus sp. Marseille-P4669]|uniref:YhgE/Pip family protein n=1 Tax=Salirhabdus sp. Marseille-P4669 TaxID=2042310 RepID=UPI000C7D11D0|nr:YhgE/Pip domain-containing protein [Salirhabdus sp. Marseille-P4669]